MKRPLSDFRPGCQQWTGDCGQRQGDEVEFDMVHRFDNRPVFANEEEYFWDILRLLSEVKIGIQKCWQKYGKVNSMAIDSWGVILGCWMRMGGSSEILSITRTGTSMSAQRSFTPYFQRKSSLR